MTLTQEPKGPPPEVTPAQSKGWATRLAANVSERGYGIDPDNPDGVPFAGLRLGALVLALVVLGWWNPWMLVVVLAIVVMITLHEFGHYITAKRAGMKVTEFFLGFGPKIWSIRRGETEYGIKAIPAGAYVKIIGMTNLEEVEPENEARTYRQKPFGRRLSVAVAGSAMHFLLAMVLIFVALAAIGQPGGTLDPNAQARDWRISQVNPGTGAAEAGLQPGDRIVSLGGRSIGNFTELRAASRPNKGKTVPITYVRDGNRVSTTITLTPYYSWFVDRTVSGTEVAKVLRPDDDILSIAGERTRTRKDLDQLLAANAGQTVPVTYRRGDAAPKTVQIKATSLILAGVEGYIGIGSEAAPNERVNPLKAVVQTPVEFTKVTGLSLQALGKFFTPGGVSDFASQVGNARSDKAKSAVPTSTESSSRLLTSGSGTTGENRLLSIYGLVRIGSSVGEVNPGALIALFALINIFIGMFNMVPLLPFDGGHVVIAVYEKVQERRQHKRRYFADVAKLLPVVYTVTAVLAVLFVSTLYLDIANPLIAR